MYDELRDLLIERAGMPGIQIELPPDGDEIFVSVPSLKKDESIFVFEGNEQLFELYLACIDIPGLTIKIFVAGAVSNINIHVFDVRGVVVHEEIDLEMIDYMREVFDTCVEIDIDKADFDLI